MLPYTPLARTAVRGGRAATSLVMTSANRSSEPIAYRRRRCAASLDRHRRRVPRRRAADRAPHRRFDRAAGSGRAERAPAARARLRARKRVAMLPRARADRRARRGSEERGHARRRRSGVREPARRRSATTIAARRGVPRDGARPVRDVRRRSGGRAHRSRRAPAVPFDGVRRVARGTAHRSPASSRARRQRRWPSVRPGTRRVVGFGIRRHRLR